MKDINMNRLLVENLLLDLQKNTDVKGVLKIIGDSIRSVTQEYQDYTITKKLKATFQEYGINVPDTMIHSELKKYSKKLKQAGFPKELLVQDSPTMTEHVKEIKVIKKELLDKKDFLISIPKVEAIDCLIKYFQDEVVMFHKLAKEESYLETRKGMDWEVLKSELVSPNRVRLVLS
jgi:hypothetical protein